MSTVKTSPNGWPLLEDSSLIADIPDYTARLANKLDKGDADVAAAINAADQAKEASVIAKSASDDLKGKIGTIETLGRDTGWVKLQLSPKNGFTLYGNGARYRLVGKMCQLEVPVYRSAGIPNEPLAIFDDLPEEIASMGPTTTLGNSTSAAILGLLIERIVKVGRISGSDAAWPVLYFTYLVA
ncbi:hypothetical protein QP568_02930 [Propionimicrobium lymphophilum]|uniref:hypothetical protein n=1 Tax=Propionimicrobium lymphophilum TaxID=33012 RepID=UPI00254A0670|nr:hypothetical protein [Propionimicrobium lymphophilum]MDK7709263.1 hypothetical protein [Propionimicrobium lymphophilum]MDK7733251.1 hypothetical protein [Propionimicrobium lymphophilum]